MLDKEKRKYWIKIILDLIAIAIFVFAIYVSVISWNEGFTSGYNVCMAKLIGQNVTIIRPPFIP